MIIKIPAINGLCKTNGVEKAPEILTKDFKNTKEIKVNNSNVEEQEKQILNQSKKYLDKKPLFVGGDHSITYPLVKNYFQKFSNLGLIILDAHPDLMPPMQNPTHEEWLSAIINLGFKSKNILLIGARSIDSKEKKYPIQTIAIQEIENSEEKIKNFAKNKKIYLSIDIDFFDSSIVSATGYPEKNGATEKQGLNLIKKILPLKIIAADIVEVNPTKPNPEQTINLSKKIIRLIEDES